METPIGAEPPVGHWLQRCNLSRYNARAGALGVNAKEAKNETRSFLKTPNLKPDHEGDGPDPEDHTNMTDEHSLGGILQLAPRCRGTRR